MSARDTIFATSSGAPPAAIAIIRLSGPRAFAIGSALATRLPPTRYAGLRALRDPRDDALLDRALVLTFPGPKSSTGEDLVEFHVHGGRAVVAAVEAAIASQSGARQADAGEFTRRALENGIIDLTAAEGLGDLLAAETEMQRRAALQMAEGGLRRSIDLWTDRLVGIAARVEAQLDFSDEDDVAAGAIQVAPEIIEIASEIEALLANPPVERLRDGIRVVIAGPPNSGKSSLLNALADRDAAIVSSISGTTRDRIEVPVMHGGLAFVLTDTAGLTNAPSDQIERIGVERARSAMVTADIVLWLGDDRAPDPSYVQIHARADVPGREVAPPHAHLVLSVATNRGLDRIWTVLAERGAAMIPKSDVLATNVRQRSILVACRERLRSAVSTADLLIVAEDLRSTLRLFDQITGRSGIEDVLDAIFSTFCIGK